MDQIVERPEIYKKINEIIMNRTHKRRLCMLYGIYGIGKTTLLDSVEKDLKNQLKIRVNFSKELYMNSPALKNIVQDFVKSSGVYYSKKQEKDSTLRDRIFSGLKNLNLGITLEMDTQGVINGGLSTNFISTIINFIENKYESYLFSTQSASIDEFPTILARITREICYACNSEIFIIVDDIDKLDKQTAVYLHSLLISDLKIALISSTEYHLNSVKNPFLKELLNMHFVNKSDSNDDYEYRLSFFNFEETFEYVNKCLKPSETINENIIRNIHEYTRGLPILLSLLCNDISDIKRISSLDKIALKSNKLDIYYNKVISNLSDNEKLILFFIVCNDTRISFNVLKSIQLKISNEIIFLTNYDSLLNQHLIEEKDEVIYLKYRMLADYINSRIDILSERSRKEYFEILKKEYIELPDSIGGFEKYYSLTKLFLKLGNSEEAFKSIIRCIDLLLKDKIPDKIVNFIYEVLDEKANNKFNTSQHSLIKFKLCNAHYLCKHMDFVIDTFNSFNESELMFIKDSYKYSELLIIISKAYYYKNCPIDAIKYAELALNENKSNDSHIYHESVTLLASAHDLLGNYETSIKIFTDAISTAQRENDILKIGTYKMTIQMVSSDYNECITELKEAINIFTNVTTNHRHLACCYNNIGIEYLMNGDLKNSYDYLLKAEDIFSKNALIESNFVDNNLGLFYYFSKDLEKALIYLKRASENSISPLQNAYSMANKGIVQYEMGKKRDALYSFLTALDFSEQCPDPIVKSYITFNLGRFYYCEGEFNKSKSFLLNSKDGLSKYQLKCLLYKREKMINSINNILLENSLNFDINIQRRKLFYQSNWEPCELMFYN